LPSCRFGGGSALRRELHSCFADQPRFELKIRTPCHHGHARPIGQPNKRPDADGSLCDVCACVAHYGPQECRQFHLRRMSRSKRREHSARQMFYVHEGGICCVPVIFERQRRRAGSKISGYGQLAEVAVYLPCPVCPGKQAPRGRAGVSARQTSHPNRQQRGDEDSPPCCCRLR
jgi:hypothetical protein